MKIRTRISLTFTMNVFFLLLILGTSIGYVTNGLVERMVIDHLETAAQSRLDHINTYLQQNIEQLELITNRTTLLQTIQRYNTTADPTDLERIQNTITDSAQPMENIDRICITDPEGNVIASTNPNYIGLNVSKKEFFIQGKKSSQLFLIEDGEEIKLYLAGPFKLDGGILGVGITVLKLDTLNNIVNEKTGMGETGEILIAIEDTNDNLRFLNQRRFEEESDVSSQDTAQPMRAALQGIETQFIHHIDYRGKQVIAVTRFAKSLELGLVAKIDHAEAMLPIKQVLITLGGIGALATLIYLLSAYFLSAKISAPLEALRKDIEIVEKGNLNHKIQIQSTGEIAKLGKAFSKMLNTVRKARQEVIEKVEQQTKALANATQNLEEQQKAILNVLEDVEHEKTISEAKAQELLKFQEAVENTSDHIIITDENGIILYANQAVERITQYTKNEIIGKKAGTKETWGGLMDKGAYEYFWKTIKTEKKAYVGELINKRKSGEEYTVEVKVSPILDKNGNVKFFVGLERDITREKEVDRMKTEFISLASHQLRTPLSAMKWYGEMLLDGDAGELNTEQRDFVQNVYESNERMIELVEALLNISRIESGRIIIDPQPTDLGKLMTEVIKDVEQKYKVKEQILIVSIHNDLKEIMIDPKLVRHVYMNLLTNAIKYTPKGGEISVIVSKEEDRVVSQVTDSGYGIPPDEHDKVFKKFFRGTNIVKHETDGTGLGLYLIKAIIDSSGGKIWFESEEGKGTTFWFTLPETGMIAKKGEVTIDN